MRAMVLATLSGNICSSRERTALQQAASAIPVKPLKNGKPITYIFYPRYIEINSQEKFGMFQNYKELMSKYVFEQSRKPTFFVKLTFLKDTRAM